MLPKPSEYKHIVLNEAGQACIEGSRYKVRMLVVEQQVHGWSPWELKWQHEDLTLAEIHAALAYYWDHKQELDADMERRRQFAEEARQQAGPSPLAAKLRAQGLLP